jgi:uncharacterized protein
MSSWYNPYLFIPFVAWFSSQVYKFLVRWAKGEVNWHLFYTSGGMPSAHSAAVCAVATTALVYEGLASPIFGLSGLFAAVVIYDSFGVRRASGDQAVALNAMLRDDAFKDSRELSTLKLREVLGHKPGEVVAGALLGVAVALLLTLDHWYSQQEWLRKAPTDNEQIIYMIVFASMVGLGLVARTLINKRRWRLTASVKALRQFLFWSLLTIGVLGLWLVLMQNQGIATGEWRLWVVGLLVAAAVLYGMSFIQWLRFIPYRYQQELGALHQPGNHAKRRKNSRKHR